MQVKNLRILFALFFLFGSMVSGAFTLSKRAEISVITCSPGNEAYSVYGHSAIRVKDDAFKYDIVFNYGIFDFNTPNFIYRFASGQTDYLLGAYRFSSFYEEYVEARRSIYEQVLNLSQAEKQKVFDYLLWNAKPENRVYRYNFFFDNCATRVRDVIKEQVNGEVVFPENNGSGKTFRQLIKDYHSKLLWLNFGVDFIVVAPADEVASASQEMFLPDYLHKHFDEARIKTGDEMRPLVKSEKVIYQAPEIHYSSLKIISPFVVFSVLLLIVIFVSIREFRKKKINYWTDYLVFGISGFAGLVMLWFVLYSEHPAMRPNFNLLWALPLNFVFALVWKVKKWRSVTRYYFVFMVFWLFLFLVASSFLPQKFHLVFYLMALTIFIRSVLNSIFILKR